MAFYETIYIVRPDLSNEQVEVVIARVGELLATFGGKILQTELWGRRDLAYPVKKSTKGYYVFHVVEGGGNMVREVEDRLKINEDILKFMNVSVVKPTLKATPMAAPPQREEGEVSEEQEGEEEFFGAVDEEELEEEV